MISHQGDGARYICKGPRCSAERHEANHWFLVWGSFHHNGVQFHCAPFSEDLIQEITGKGWKIMWVCGSACAQRVFETYLDPGVTFVI